MKWICVLCFAVSLNVSPAKAGGTNDDQLKRGRYLVEAAGACADCHTARDWKGTPDRGHWLQGATLDFKPSRIMPWAGFAPDIAGLPSFPDDASAVKFFETGINAAGKTCSPPMSQYRFDRDDALAVVAYLRSVPAKK